MNKTTETILMPDGKELLLHIWKPLQEPLGLLQLVHGSCEHIGRYEAFAAYMAYSGYIVYGWDLRGHGITASSREELGFFALQGGWELLLSDILEINKHIRTEYPHKPLILIGHSMGSFLVRHFALLNGDTINGLIAIGTSHNPRLLLKLGKHLANRDIIKNGHYNRSKLLHNLSYGSFNKKISPARTTQDWLTSDEEIVDKFVDDELCGFVLTSSGFRDMFYGLLEITNTTNIKGHPKDLPMLLISGEEDPVGEWGRQVIKAYESYKRAGVKNISMKLYEGMRHEVLNEHKRQRVYEDIVNWLKGLKHQIKNS